MIRDLALDALDVENIFVVDERAEERGGGAVGDQKERAEDQRLDRFFDAKNECDVLFGGLIAPEVDRDEAGEEDGAEANAGENVELLVFHEVPDAVGEWQAECDDHSKRWPEVPRFPLVLA